MCQSGTLARRSQHVATCPARTPEFKYKNRRPGGPCTATPKRRGVALPASLATRTCVVNVILPLAVATGASSASLPICSAHVTPAGGPSTTTRRVRDAGESIVATPDRGTAVTSYSRLTLRLTAARRPRSETKPVYPDYRHSPDLPEADGAAVAVEPVVRTHLIPTNYTIVSHTARHRDHRPSLPQDSCSESIWLRRRRSFVSSRHGHRI